MKEQHIYQQIILEISDKESEKHLRECRHCRDVLSKVDETMLLLDKEVEVPEGISETIMPGKEKTGAPVSAKFSFSTFLQISLVILTGIFLGFILGKNADISVFQSSKARFRHSLIEFREVHHLNIDESTFSI